MVEVHVAVGDELAVAARLLRDFNLEYGEPSPAVDELTVRLTELVGDGDTTVLLAGDGLGLGVLRFRKAIWATALECYLAELYVAPDRRGAGLGRALLQSCLDHARARGAAWIELTTTEDDVAARHLYERPPEPPEPPEPLAPWPPGPLAPWPF
jgi:ribosomal protein S18 acetylase RimI-like enzyme